jgi:F0F1-type ATP synthase membrane subunit b/b'
MNDDELKSLLQRAEAGLEKRSPVASELAGRVRRLDRRRGRRSRALWAAVPLAVVAGIATWQFLPSGVGRKPDQKAASVPVDVREIERLRAEAEYYERTARQMIARAEREGSSKITRAAWSESDPFAEIREQVDTVAYRMILRADDLQAAMMQSQEAVELYRQVVQLFPKTYSAEVARKRLSDLGASVEET